jgi:hypothetical protein
VKGEPILRRNILTARNGQKIVFLRSGIVDFDAECSLGGFPDEDTWFPTEEEHYEKFMHIIYKF